MINKLLYSVLILTVSLVHGQVDIIAMEVLKPVRPLIGWFLL